MPVPDETPRSTAGPGYRHGDVGYVSLAVGDVERAAAFYRLVLGWNVDADAQRGRVSDVIPVVGLTPSAAQPTLFCCFAVGDLDEALDAISRAGGSVTATTPRPEGRAADCVDDQGVAFAVYEPVDASGPRPPANGSGPGELSYLTLEVVDSARARAFYGAVLGWRFTPGRIDDGWQVADTTPMIGLSGGHDQATAVPMWRVADVDDAVRAVREAGGTADDPTDEPFGRTATCTDDQGSRFYLGEL
jgi:predicted enzyme related to lactoylglutathione lyase